MKANGCCGGFSIGLSANGIIVVVAWLAVLLVPSSWLRAATPEPVAFTQSAPATGIFDFIEVTATVRAPTARNPFTDAALTRDFEPAGSAPGAAVEGFCDSTNGSRYHIRFMPSKAGVYGFHVTFKDGQESHTYSGQFTATDQHRRGPLRVDPAYPWHLIWAGTGEHYFFNGTTAYWLVGWRDEPTIQYCIDRLARPRLGSGLSQAGKRAGAALPSPAPATQSLGTRSGWGGMAFPG